jgi:hypothetical protein
LNRSGSRYGVVTPGFRIGVGLGVTVGVVMMVPVPLIRLFNV